MDFVLLLQTYSSISYLIMFLIAFLEVLVFIGAFFPGQLLIITSGVLAQRGALDLTTLIIVISLGTLFGNIFSYYLGKFYGEKFLLRFGKLFYLEKKHIQITKMYMKEHSGKTLILGRFNHVIRSFIPFIAGTTDVSLTKFMTYNLIGTVAWTVVFVMIGYILGETLDLAVRYVSLISMGIALLIGIIFYIFVKRNYNKIEIP